MFLQSLLGGKEIHVFSYLIGSQTLLQQHARDVRFTLVTTFGEQFCGWKYTHCRALSPPSHPELSHLPKLRLGLRSTPAPPPLPQPEAAARPLLSGSVNSPVLGTSDK